MSLCYKNELGLSRENEGTRGSFPLYKKNSRRLPLEMKVRPIEVSPVRQFVSYFCSIFNASYKVLGTSDDDLYL